jgi:hypothetical protein
LKDQVVLSYLNELVMSIHWVQSVVVLIDSHFERVLIILHIIQVLIHDRNEYFEIIKDSIDFLLTLAYYSRSCDIITRPKRYLNVFSYFAAWLCLDLEESIVNAVIHACYVPVESELGIISESSLRTRD